MNANNISAGSGWTWIKQALALIKRFPQVFLVMGLILGFFSVIPFLGALVMWILSPALIGGTVYAAHVAERGQSPEIGQLFQSFQDSDRMGPMIALCLPLIAVGLTVVVLLVIFAVGAAVGSGLSAASASDPMALFAAMGAGALILIPVVIVLALVGWALTWFAIPRVLLDHVDAFAAMKESFRAAREHIGAFLLAIVSIGIGFVILACILLLLHLGWIGSLIANAAMYSVLGPTIYYGYRAIFGGEPVKVNEAASSPPPPPAAEPPPPPPA